jgi:hypothetical protein
MIEREFCHFEDSETIGFSHSDFGLVQPLDNAAGKCLACAEIVEQEFSVSADGADELQQTNSIFLATSLPIKEKNCSKLSRVRSLPTHSSCTQPASIW